MNLTAENTAIVIDSTADFPEAPERYPNFRVVPLYVLFGEESFKDYVDITPDRFYERLRTEARLPTTSQPTPGDFLADLRGARAALRADHRRCRSPRRSRARSAARRRRQGCSAATRCG